MNTLLRHTKLILLCCFLCGGVSLRAQDTVRKPLYLGIGAEALLSSSGHGGFYAGYVAIGRGRSIFKAGPIMHKRTSQITGYKISYSYRLVSMNGEDIYSMSFSELKPGTCQLNLVPFIMYENSTGLSYKRAREEGIFSGDSLIDWNKVTLTTFEGGLCADFSVKVCPGVLWDVYLGISAFTHLNYPQGMYYDKSGVALIMGTGISFPGIRFGGRRK